MKKSWQSWDSNPGQLGEKRKRYLCAMLPPKANRDEVGTFGESERVAPLIELADRVEAAVARLDEVGRAALHDEADVRGLGLHVVELLDAFELSVDEAEVGMFHDALVHAAMERVRRRLSECKFILCCKILYYKV